ncbi:3-keto-disaccharide hydrolase [Rubripirellula lacrimiformis]|nr:DUF1080 domain-containing protein [Rubripirellula lacrimiformis]
MTGTPLKNHRPLLPLVLVLCAAFTATADDDWQSRSLPLFDEHSLAGWEGNAYWFRIENDESGTAAVVAGRLDQKIPHNEFLCTTQNYDNFELRYEVKLVGKGQNAGVQFRSKRVKGTTEVSGYQADAGQVGDRPVWGALYDESRRRKMLAEGNADEVRQWVKQDDWNQLRVVCRDRHIQIFLNGEKSIDYTETDDSIPGYGVIGLQIHSGPPTEAWYRNIRVQQFQVTK